MAKNIGTLITSPIRPNDSLDPIAVAYAYEIKGGLHTVNSISDRDNIIIQRREWGMLCYVINEDKLYQLKYNYHSNDIMDNLNWVVFNSANNISGEWIDSVISKLSAPPLNPSNGDRYLIVPLATGVWTGNEYKIAEWNSTTSNWIYTIPTNGLSIRIDNEDDSIYRYEGVYPSGVWIKEELNQVKFIIATSSNGSQYTAVSNQSFNSYNQNNILLVNFTTPNSGTVSLNINNIGEKMVKKLTGTGLADIDPNDITPGYIYIITYDGNYFQINIPSGSTSSGVIGPAEDNDYTDGLFTDFTPTTPIGTAIDRFNEILKSLVPPPAPPLSDWSGSKVGSVNGKLSFDANNPILGFNYISATNSPTNPVAVDGLWSISGKRLGISPSASNDISGVLNYQVSTHSGVPTPAYIAKSFGDANLGQLIMIVNGVTKSSVNLTNLNSIDTTVGGLVSGFSLSAATNSRFPQGDPFDNFWYRTGSWLLKGNDPDIVLGYNYVYVIHQNLPHFNRQLDRFEFIIDHNTDPTIISNPTFSYTFTGNKKLSGISYYTGGTISYDVTIDNLYKNTYYAGNDAISFNDISTGSTIPIVNTSATLALANCNGNEAKQFKISNPDQLGSPIIFNIINSGKRRINESISINTTAKRTVQGTTTGGTITINNILLDNVNPTSTPLIENFDDENYRLKNTYGSFQYDLYSMISVNQWDSNQSLIGSTLGYNNGLQVINGKLVYPKTDFSSIGNLTTNLNYGNSLTNYSTATGNRMYIRYFRQVSPTTGNFTMIINGSGGNFVPVTTPLTGNNIWVEIKAPGATSKETGWLDAYTDFSTGQWNDGDGCRNASSGLGRAFGVTWGLTIGTKNTANTNGYMLIRITVGPSFNGYIDNIIWNFT